MKEQDTHGKPEFERSPEVFKLPAENIEAASAGEIASLQEEVTAAQTKQQEQRTEAAKLVRSEVHEVFDKRGIEELIQSIDFSEDKYDFSTMNSYHAKAKTFDANTVTRGRLQRTGHYYLGDRSTNEQWGDPRETAHRTRQAVEQAGIRKVEYGPVNESVRVPRGGLAGKLGLKKWERVETSAEEPKYYFDYAFNAPSHGDDDAQRAGNYTGQSLQLSVELTQEQAESLSKILADNPKAARSVLDHFMRTTGDAGKWDAELYDDEGNFYDPGERYGEDRSNPYDSGHGVLEARDVRPQFDAVPDLEPRIVGLLGAEPAKNERAKSLPAA